MLTPAPISQVLAGPPPPRFQLASTGPPADAQIARLLNEASIHCAAALASPYAVGLDILGDIVLPPGAEARIDEAQMRAIGALYLAADLDAAGIIGAVEDLAALSISGGLTLDLGSAAPLLHSFWQDRNNRLDRSERAGFFARMFGESHGTGLADVPTNQEFDMLMIETCEALYRLDEFSGQSPHGGIAQQSRLRAVARNTIANLALAGGGITPFLATEIIGTINQAIAILSDKHLRGVFMSRDIWGVVAAINRLTRTRGQANPRDFVRRGRAGMAVIVWLADAALILDRPGIPLVQLDNPVVVAAVEWLQSSLSISERQQQRASPAETSYASLPSAAVSPWAEIGA